jgi:hypothetical protein
MARKFGKITSIFSGIFDMGFLFLRLSPLISSLELKEALFVLNSGKVLKYKRIYNSHDFFLFNLRYVSFSELDVNSFFPAAYGTIRWATKMIKTGKK